MRPTSPLSLIIFLRLVCAAPILLPDCQSSACTAFLSTPHTPPTRLAQPHLPTRQTASITSSSHDESFDNSPLTPPISASPAKALTGHQPLASAYLRSLENPASHPEQADSIRKGTEAGPGPAKPTSALPELQKEDARTYWATRIRPTDEDVSAASHVDGSRQDVHLCGTMSYQLVHRTKMSRDYSDFLVVGIVLLFLAVIVALEAVEKVEALRSFFTGRRRSSRGQIYLADDDNVAFTVKRPFSLQAAPPPKCYRVSMTEYEDHASSNESKSYHEEYITEKEQV